MLCRRASVTAYGPFASEGGGAVGGHYPLMQTGDGDGICPRDFYGR